VRTTAKPATAAAPSVEVDAFLSKARQEVIALLMKGGPKSEAYSLTTAVKTAVKLESGEFKVMALPQTDYTFSGAYFGKRGHIIFCFTPLDAQDFAHAEFTTGGLGAAFPSIIPAFQEVMIDSDAELQSYNLVHEMPTDALEAMITAAIEGRVEALKQAAEEVEQKAKRAEEDFYAGNPEWGLF
jgi:hypothetical protein